MKKIRIIWEAFVALLCKVRYGTMLHVVAGLVIAAFFCIALGMKACIVPAVFAGFLKVLFDQFTADRTDWRNLAATAVGGLVPQIFVLLHAWWF